MRRLVLFVLLIGLLPAAAYAAVPYYTGPYSNDGSGCGTRTDPINVIWTGTYAYAQNVSGQINYHAGWGATDGSNQSLWVTNEYNNNVCRDQNFQRASTSAFGNTRFHTRIWYIPRFCCDDKKSVGDAHHEDWVWSCPGHAVDSNGSNGSGFDWGRRKITGLFAADGHFTSNDYWGNTQNFHQCDGDWAGSNGTGAFIGVYHEQG